MAKLDQAKRALAPAQRAQVAAIRSAEAQLKIAIAPGNNKVSQPMPPVAEAPEFDAKARQRTEEENFIGGTTVPCELTTQNLLLVMHWPECL